jgi:hypothetical protein
VARALVIRRQVRPDLRIGARPIIQMQRWGSAISVCWERALDAPETTNGPFVH